MDTAQTWPGGRLLAAWREAQGITQTDLATRLGVRQPTVAAWGGVGRPELALALALEVHTDGAVPVESWGYAEDLELARGVLAARAVAEEVCPSPTLPAEVIRES